MESISNYFSKVVDCEYTLSYKLRNWLYKYVSKRFDVVEAEKSPEIPDNFSKAGVQNVHRENHKNFAKFKYVAKPKTKTIFNKI